jgi:ketosteroid isomerase-like protein
MNSELEAKDAVRETLFKANFYADTAQTNRFGECYADDCVVTSQATGPVSGIEAVTGFVKAGTADGIKWRHITGNHVIQVSGDKAHVWSSLVLLMQRDTGKFEIELAGFYEDQMVRLGGSWKIKHRTVHYGPSTLGTLWS